MRRLGNGKTRWSNGKWTNELEANDNVVQEGFSTDFLASPRLRPHRSLSKDFSWRIRGEKERNSFLLTQFDWSVLFLTKTIRMSESSDVFCLAWSAAKEKKNCHSAFSPFTFLNGDFERHWEILSEIPPSHRQWWAEQTSEVPLHTDLSLGWWTKILSVVRFHLRTQFIWLRKVAMTNRNVRRTRNFIRSLSTLSFVEWPIRPANDSNVQIARTRWICFSRFDHLSHGLDNGEKERERHRKNNNFVKQPKIISVGCNARHTLFLNVDLDWREHRKRTEKTRSGHALLSGQSLPIHWSEDEFPSRNSEEMSRSSEQQSPLLLLGSNHQ